MFAVYNWCFFYLISFVWGLFIYCWSIWFIMLLCLIYIKCLFFSSFSKFSSRLNCYCFVPLLVFIIFNISNSLLFLKLFLFPKLACFLIHNCILGMFHALLILYLFAWLLQNIQKLQWYVFFEQSPHNSYELFI